MRFGLAPERPHEDRPLRTGDRAASILIAFRARPEADVDAVIAEVEDAVRAALGNWYGRRGHALLESAPDVT